MVCDISFFPQSDSFWSTTGFVLIEMLGGKGKESLSKALWIENHARDRKPETAETDKNKLNSPLTPEACASRRSVGVGSCTLPSSGSVPSRCCAGRPAPAVRWPRSSWLCPSREASAQGRRLQVSARCPRWWEYQTQSSRWRRDSRFASSRASSSSQFVVPRNETRN